MIFTNELEQQVLGGILNNKDLYIQSGSVLAQDLFAVEVNSVIFSVIQSSIVRGEDINRVLLANKLKNQGISFADKNIEIGDYTDIIAQYKPTERDFVSSVKELVRLSSKRFFIESADKFKKTLLKDNNMTVSQMEDLYGKTLSAAGAKVYSDDDTIDLLDGLYEEIEERGNVPIMELGYKTGFEKIDDACPIAKPGSSTVIAARTGNGKSTLLLDLAYNISALNDADVLVLDSEMDKGDTRHRLAAAITGVPLAYIASGRWREVDKYIQMVRSSGVKEKIKNAKIHFKFMPDSDIESIRSTVKKWYYSKVGKHSGKKAALFYDYIKITSDESSSKAAQEYVLMGDKVNAINKLVSKDCVMPAMTAIQNNRSNTDEKGRIRDDAGSVGGSDRVIQYCSCMAILRRKNEDELANEGEKFGSHKLVWLKQRHQGFAAMGHNEFIKADDGRFVRNFVNLEIKNFKVREIGLGEDMYAELALKQPPKKEDAKKPYKKESL